MLAPALFVPAPLPVLLGRALADSGLSFSPYIGPRSLPKLSEAGAVLRVRGLVYQPKLLVPFNNF